MTLGVILGVIFSLFGVIFVPLWNILRKIKTPELLDFSGDCTDFGALLKYAGGGT